MENGEDPAGQGTSADAPPRARRRRGRRRRARSPGRSQRGALARGARKPVAGKVASTRASPPGSRRREAIVLWTRVSELDRTSKLTLEVARDRGFRRRRAPPRARREAARLHRPRAGPRPRPRPRVLLPLPHAKSDSMVGRFRTAASAGLRRPLRIGFFSCQCWQAGYYTAHAGAGRGARPRPRRLPRRLHLREPHLPAGPRAGTRPAERRRRGADARRVPRQVPALPVRPESDRDAGRPPVRRGLGRPRGRGQLAGEQPAAGRRATASPTRPRPPRLVREAPRNGYKAFFEAMPRIRRSGEPNADLRRARLGALGRALPPRPAPTATSSHAATHLRAVRRDRRPRPHGASAATQKQWLKSRLASSAPPGSCSATRSC